jgi:hypothetical protein
MMKVSSLFKETGDVVDFLALELVADCLAYCRLGLTQGWGPNGVSVLFFWNVGTDPCFEFILIYHMESRGNHSFSMCLLSIYSVLGLLWVQMAVNFWLSKERLG